MKSNPHLFDTKILTTHQTKNEALERESKFQKQLNVVSSPLYINMSVSNEHLYPPRICGRSPSESTRKKLSLANIGHTHSQETKQKISNSKLGIPRSKDTIKKMSLSKIGVRLSDEHKKKISLALKGKKRSAEVRTRMSIAQKGRTVSDETRKKISDSRRGAKRNPHSIETKIKISEANRGKKRTPECIEKMRLLNTGRVHTQEMRDRYKKHYMIEYYDGTREKIFGKVEFLKKLGIDRNRFERCMKKQQPVCGIVSCIEIKDIHNAII